MRTKRCSLTTIISKLMLRNPLHLTKSHLKAQVMRKVIKNCHKTQKCKWRSKWKRHRDLLSESWNVNKTSLTEKIQLRVQSRWIIHLFTTLSITTLRKKCHSLQSCNNYLAPQKAQTRWTRVFWLSNHQLRLSFRAAVHQLARITTHSITQLRTQASPSLKFKQKIMSTQPIRL